MNLKLRPMTPQEYQSFIDESIPRFAQEKIDAHAWLESVALKNAQDAYARILPHGQNTSHHLFLQIEDHDQSLGYIWVMIEEDLLGKSAFIYQIQIDQTHQNKGIGSQALSELETYLKSFDVNRISLHVFANNDRALHVYQKSGFVFTDHNLTKKLI